MMLQKCLYNLTNYKNICLWFENFHKVSLEIFLYWVGLVSALQFKLGPYRLEMVGHTYGHT